MKLLILVSFLTPFYNKRFTGEYLCLVLFFSMPLLWQSWESLPTVWSLAFMMDKLSTVLVLLSLWVSIIMVYTNPSDKRMDLNIILLLLSLIAFFSVSSLLAVFILFEACLIPTICLIMGWGYQPERLEASYYLVFYTIVLSVPLLVSMMWIAKVSGSKYFYCCEDLVKMSGLLSFLLLSVFLVKLPLFMVHFWLPKAHVEAPLVGSMILAGVLLKTGGYGVMRITTISEGGSTMVMSCFKILGLMGMIYVCFVCLYSTDLKQMIAFSSVSHMNFMTVGLMTSSVCSFSGSTIMMVSHGLCSSLMFFLADLSYKRCSSRSVLVNKGMLLAVPTLSMFWSISCLLNMAVPPSAGSFSELLIILTTSSIWLCKIAFGIYLLFSAFYSVYLYMVINHGNSGTGTYSLTVKENLLVLMHLIPLVGLTLMIKFMLI